MNGRVYYKKQLNIGSKNKHSMTAILRSDWESLMNEQSKESLYSHINKLFKDNSLDTLASRRLLTNVYKSRNLQFALTTVCNSVLAGYGMAID